MKKLFVCATALLLLFSTGPAATAMAAGLFEDVQIHGFISQGFLYSDEYNYLAHNSTDGSFEYNEIGINFSKNLSDKLRLGIQFFSRDLGDVSNNKIALDWAYADYRFQDWLGLRAGRIKLPYALYNEIRDVDLLRTNIVMPQSLYSDLLREVLIAYNGAGAYGNIDLKSLGALDYQVVVGSMNVDGESGTTKSLNNTLAGINGQVASEATGDTNYCGAVRWSTPLPGLLLAYAYNNTELAWDIDFGAPSLLTFDLDTTSIVYSAEYVWNDLILSIEYQTLEYDQQVQGFSKHTQKSENYYLSAAYRFNDLFTLGAYYSVSYPFKDNKDGDDPNQLIGNKAWEKDIALTLRFDLSQNCVFKVEGHRVDGTANVMMVDNPDADWTEDTWYYGAAKVTFSF